jgi:DNA-binding HxlR family transcriptional regulator
MIGEACRRVEDGTSGCLGYLEGTVPAPAGGRAREVLERVGDKWSLLVISLLGERTRRFTDLRRSIDGISQRMLTVTLRGLERDGLVTHTVHPTVPPRVDAALTPMGRILLDTVRRLVEWADSHLPEIDAARAEYGRRAASWASPVSLSARLGHRG